MKLIGFLFLVAGWVIAIAAILLLTAVARGGFVCIGIILQIVGVVLTTRSHRIFHQERG